MLRYYKGISFAFLSLLSRKKIEGRGGREQWEAGTHMPAQPAPWYPDPCGAAGQVGTGRLSTKWG